MHFGFTLELSDIDLWNIDLLDTHLDLLDTDITSKHLACLGDVLKTSSRYVFKTSSRHVFKTSSRHVFKLFRRRLQRNNFSSSKTSSRRLGRRKIITLKTYWRRLQDTSSRPKSACWDVEYIIQVSFVAVERQLIHIILVLVMLSSYYFSLANSL